jgi:hypothetical protein
MANLVARLMNAGAAAVEWKATFVLAAMRSACAGVVWAIASLLLGAPEQFLPLLLFGTVIGLVIMVPLGLISMAAAKLFPPIGLLGLLPQVYMVAGDPILWVIEKFRPGTIPMADFKPVNFNTLLIIFSPAVVEMTQQAKETARSATSYLGQMASDKIRNRNGKGATSAPDNTRVDVNPNVANQAQQMVYGTALDELKRLASEGGTSTAVDNELMKIKGLVDAGCSFFGPYKFLAEQYIAEDLIGNFDHIMDVLEKGRNACRGDKSIQGEIEVSYFAVGKLCWDLEQERLAFRAYIRGLNIWRENGNVISQSSPLLPRIAFVASRMFVKNALQKEGDASLGVEFLEFCEASGVDINLTVSVSDARSP